MKHTLKIVTAITLVILYAKGNAQNNKRLFESNFSDGKAFYDQGKYEVAIPLLEKSYSIAQIAFKRNDVRKIKITRILADVYIKTHQLNKAESLYVAALGSNKKNKLSPSYKEFLKGLVEVYTEQERYDKILPLYRESLVNDEKQYGKNHFKYAISLRNVADMYKALGETQKALAAALDAEEIIIKTLGKEDFEYAICEIVLANIYDLMGDYSRSISYWSEATSVLEKKTEHKRFEYAQSLSDLALMYRKVGKYDQAVSLYLKSIDQLEQASAARSIYYGRTLSGLGHVYELKNEYDKSELTLLKGIEAVEKCVGKNHSEYSTILSDLAHLYEVMGQYDKAIDLFREVVDIDGKLYGKESLYYAYGIGNLASVYMKKKQYELALPFLLEAVDIAEKKIGKNHPEYSIILMTLGILYDDTKEYDKALIAYLESIALQEKFFGKEDKYYAYNLAILGGLYTKMGKNEQALPLLSEALEKAVMWKNNAIYQTVLANLISFHYKNKQYDKALIYCLEGNQNLIKFIKSAFAFQSENEKKMYFSTFSDSFHLFQSIDYQTQHVYRDLTETNLNNQLFLKGILLNSSKDVIRKLASLNDSLVGKDLNSFVKLKETLNKQLSIAPSKRTMNLDSLSNKVEEFESNLVRVYSSRFKNDFNFDTSFRDIQAKLGQNEVAVEFSKFCYRDWQKCTDSTIYVGFLIKKKMIYPKVITLFEEKQLKALLVDKSPNRLYASRGAKAKSASGASEGNARKLFNLIWKPIEKEIGNAKTIYYAPDGLLHQIPFATLDDGKKHLARKYHLVQVSSTGKIANGFAEPETDNALFIGGITYDYQPLDKKTVNSQTHAYLENPTLDKNKSTRGGSDSWNYLPGTLNEIDGIQAIFRSDAREFKTLSGNDATETAFKALSGNSPKVLHIATHGFFFENLPIEKSNSNNPYKTSEDPLLRSGLILSGANQAWVKGSNPYEEEDGILTSMEISNLDLSKTDMVVLSACDTGLGDIDGSEGVYGLQRAFKMAGVKIIVMSLWQVPDAETAEFMKLFYGNWLKVGKVQDAFNKAQKTMMKKYRNEPLKWAGFVMFE